MKINYNLSSLIRRNYLKFALFSAATVGLSVGFSSCEMINEDLAPCAPRANTITIVNFEYDYNMQQVDLVNDHVGSIYLYVFDKDGVYDFRSSKHRVNMPLNKVDFSMAFDTTYIKPGHEYQFVAVAQGNWAGYQNSLETPGFTLQTEMIPGVSTIEDYRLKLDRNNDGVYDFAIDTDGGVFDYKKHYADNEIKLDTLWSTKPNQVQIVDIPYITHELSPIQIPNDTVYVTVPLMRLTNSIKVNLTHTSFSETTDPNIYDILIDFPNGNGTVGFTGKTYPVQDLWYMSIRKQMKVYNQKTNGAQYEADAPPHFGAEIETKGVEGEDYPTTRATQYAINAEFGVSRMQTTDGSSLQIRDAESGEVIVKIDDFSKWLAEYFNSYFDDQEFLDREYDWTVDIHLDDNARPQSIQVGCYILGWGKRIHFYELQ